MLIIHAMLKMKPLPNSSTFSRISRSEKPCVAFRGSGFSDALCQKPAFLLLSVLLKVSLIVVLTGISILAGCNKEQETKLDDSEYLIRVGRNVVTLRDFNNALDIEGTAYPENIRDDHEAFGKLQLQVMKQLTERLILQERARELHIWVSDPEIEEAISEIKTGYPEGEFENVLLESAISYDLWKKELKARLLMEKVVARDMGERIVITPEDMATYHQEHHPDKSPDSAPSLEEMDDMAIRQIYRIKSEKAYQSWIRELQEKYAIEINKERWEKLTGS